LRRPPDAAVGRSALLAGSRAGFEGEVAVDLARAAAAVGAPSAPTAVVGAGYATAWADGLDAAAFRERIAAHPPIFARNAIVGTGPHAIGSEDQRTRADRMPPLLAAIDDLARDPAQAPPWCSVWVEYPDTNDGKALTRLAGVLQSRLASALGDAGRIDANADRRLHVFLRDGRTAWIGTSVPEATRWPLGIPRLRRDVRAPSRSAQKLAEAIVVFLAEREADLLRAGQRAVDLGAAPGGWSWVLASRGLQVVAVDNGPLKGEVAHNPRVRHLRADGLTWRSPRPVDWLVCDIVERPTRIAELVAGWIADGDAQAAIFNLKLPMKQRYDEVRRCEALIEQRLRAAGVRATLAIRHLYHDREEVTGYVARAAPARGCAVAPPRQRPGAKPPQVV
jgi:23S rRNA (cytidine2498-2'-O)-methyltransferase